MTSRLVISPPHTVELEAFVEKVTPSALASGAIGVSIRRVVKNLSVPFDPRWPDTEKLAWLFVANLAAMPARQKRLARTRHK